jgi:hypothetical protein
MQVFMTKSGQKHSRLNSCKHKRRDYWITTGRISRFCSSIVPLHCSLAVAGRLKARSCAERKGPRDVATSELLKSARLVKKRTRHSEQPTTRNLHLNDNGMLQSMLSGLLLALSSISTTSRRVRICLFTSNSISISTSGLHSSLVNRLLHRSQPRKDSRPKRRRPSCFRDFI